MEYVMARDIFGNRKTIKDDRYTKSKVTHSDVRWEYVKAVCWLVLGYMYFHFVIMGW